MFAGFTAATALHGFLRGRCSIRRYRAEPPGRDIIERILESAAAAPSAHNRQPWRFLVVEDRRTKETLAQAMGKRLAADRARDGDAEQDIERDVARSHERITAAPVVILAATSLAEMDAYPDETRARAEYLMAVQSTAMALQNLLLAAHAEGLGACWMCAPLFCEDTVRAALEVPPDWMPQALVTLGYPAGPPKPRPRKPLAEFVRFA